jgi:hypothetical protein
VVLLVSLVVLLLVWLPLLLSSCKKFDERLL